MSMISKGFERAFEYSVVRPISKSKKCENFFTETLSKKVKGVDTYHNSKTLNDKLDSTLPVAVGLWVGGFYMQKTLGSNLPKERKQTLALNCGITSALGAIGGIALNKVLSSFKGNMIDKVETMFKKDATIGKAERQLIKTGAKAAIPLATSCFAFRYLAPVIATPLADQATKFCKKVGIFKEEQPSKVQEMKLNILK